MGVITKPSSVQRSVIVRLQVACGMAAGCGSDHSQRAPRRAVYRRHALLPRAHHAPRLTQTVHKKRAFVHGWAQTTGPVVLECLGRLPLMDRESGVNRAIHYTLCPQGAGGGGVLRLRDSEERQDYTCCGSEQNAVG